MVCCLMRFGVVGYFCFWFDVILLRFSLFADLLSFWVSLSCVLVIVLFGSFGIWCFVMWFCV